MIYENDIKFKQYKNLIYDIMSTVCGWTNIHQPTLHQDMKQCTDLVSNQGKAAVRIRKASYRFRDLTIRNKQSDCKSQIDKIQNSPITHYLLMYQNQNTGTIQQVYIIDVDQMRRQKIFGIMLYNYMSNNDGTGFFYISLEYLRNTDCLLWEYSHHSRQQGNVCS